MGAIGCPLSMETGDTATSRPSILYRRCHNAIASDWNYCCRYNNVDSENQEPTEHELELYNHKLVGDGAIFTILSTLRDIASYRYRTRQFYQQYHGSLHT